MRSAPSTLASLCALVAACASIPDDVAPGDRGGFAGERAAGSGEGGETAQAGATAASAGAAGKSGAASSAGAVGRSGAAGKSEAAGSSGAAGKSGASGTAAGAAGQGGAGGSAAVNVAASCGADWKSCLLLTANGNQGYLAVQSTGGVALARKVGPPLEPAVMTILEPVGGAALAKMPFPAHGLVAFQQGLAVSSVGDALFVWSPTAEQTVSPQTTDATNDALLYRGVASSGPLVAWTGRQGYELLYSDEIFSCKTPGETLACTRTVAAAQMGTGYRAGWGVAILGKVIYWSHADGFSSLDTSVNPPKRRDLLLPGTKPGSLAVAGGYLVAALPESVLLVALNLQGVLEAPIPGLASVVDVVETGGSLLVAGPSSTGKGAVYAASEEVDCLRVAAPEGMKMRSAVAAPDGIYVVADRGDLTDVFRLPKP